MKNMSYEKENKPSGNILDILYFIVTLLIVFILVFNASRPQKYNIIPGTKSIYDIRANRDIVDTEAAKRIAEEAKNQVTPVLKQDDTYIFEMFAGIDGFTNLVKRFIRNVRGPDITLNTYEAADKMVRDSYSSYNIALSWDMSFYIIENSTEDDIENVKSEVIATLTRLLNYDTTNENIDEKLQDAQDELISNIPDRYLAGLGFLAVKSVLKPGRVIDAELTDIKKTEAYNRAYENAAKTERILEGERILSVGEIVTENHVEIVRELGILDEGSGPDLAYAGTLLVIILIMLSLLYLYFIYIYDNKNTNKVSIQVISAIIIICVSISWVASKFVDPLAMPALFIPMAAGIIYGGKAAFVMNLPVVIILSLMCGNDFSFIVTSVVAGTVTGFLVEGISQRSKLWLIGVISAGMNGFIILIIGLMHKAEARVVLDDTLVASIIGIGSMILVLGLIPLIEVLFNLVTPMKLLELSNPNQPLLKRLLTEAPGTYHHSLMVGNMAEVACSDIGCNATLARVASYYHDIGKVVRPHYFKENQNNDNPHEGIDPDLSARIIKSHVRDGVEFLKNARLPTQIIDITRQHHGNTYVVYFLHKALNSGENTKEDITESDFRYSGPKPTSKEAAVVMLADSVEAAVNSLPDKEESKVYAMVRKIIDDKIADRQLDNVDITLAELSNVAKAFIKVLSGYFHKREVYPKLTGEIIDEKTEHTEQTE